MLGIIGLAIAFVLMNWFALLKPDEGVEVYLFGTHWATYLPNDFKKGLGSEEAKKYTDLKIRTGWFIDLIIVIWPFWQMYKFSTSGTKIQIHAGDIFTKGTELHPRVELHADPVFLIRFLTIREVIRGIGLFSMVNLEKMCPIGKEGTDVYYKDTLLAFHVREQIQELFLEALRQAAGRFIWSSNNPGSGTEREIATLKNSWEILTLYILASPESLIAQARILTRDNLPPAIIDALEGDDEEEFFAALKKLKPKNLFGTTIVSVDINITGLDLAAQVANASDAQNAINKQFIKQQEAQGNKSIGFAAAEVTERQGQADAVRITAVGEAQRKVAEEMAKMRGVDPNTVLLGQMVGEHVQNINVTGIGEGITEAVIKALKGKT